MGDTHLHKGTHIMTNPFVRNSDRQLLAFYWADKDLGREPSPLVVEELDRRNLAGRRPAMVTR